MLLILARGSMLSNGDLFEVLVKRVKAGRTADSNDDNRGSGNTVYFNGGKSVFKYVVHPSFEGSVDHIRFGEVVPLLWRNVGSEDANEG